ncbi:hypothetical protein [Actinomadura nitritigenes]|uniref:hypothetical protein n=1 Tax=Actinomadura nitritigenes TaxID=134602 RepID=UPI003D8EB347
MSRSMSMCLRVIANAMTTVSGSVTTLATANPSSELPKPNSLTNAASSAYPAMADSPTRQLRNTIHGDQVRNALGVYRRE